MMKFGSCSDCKKYKYLPNGTECKSCLPETVWNVEDNSLILGGIGSGKTVTMKQHLIRVLDKTDRKVYVIDPVGAYDDLESSYDSTRIKIDKDAKLDTLNSPSFLSNHLVVEKLIEESNNVPVSSLLKHRIKKHVNSSNRDTFSNIKTRIKNASRARNNGKDQQKLDEKLRDNIQAFEGTIHDCARDLDLDTDTQLNIIEINCNITSTNMFSVFNAVYMETQSVKENSVIAFDHSSRPVNSPYLRLITQYVRDSSDKTSISFVTAQTEFLKIVDAKKFIDNFETKLCFKSNSSYPSKFYRYTGIGKADKQYLESNMKTGECLLNSDSGWKRGSIVLNNREKSIIN